MFSRKTLCIAYSFLLCLELSACGVRGELYLPPPPQLVSPAVTQPNAASSSPSVVNTPTPAEPAAAASTPISSSPRP